MTTLSICQSQSILPPPQTCTFPRSHSPWKLCSIATPAVWITRNGFPACSPKRPPAKHASLPMKTTHFFSGRQLHQKVETGDIQLLQVDADSVLATARGQLIRNGIFDDEPFSEVVPVNVRFTFTRNPDMLGNGAFPTVVTLFELETPPSPQS